VFDRHYMTRVARERKVEAHRQPLQIFGITRFFAADRSDRRCHREH
jgi:hypothetical protein